VFISSSAVNLIARRWCPSITLPAEEVDMPPAGMMRAAAQSKRRALDDATTGKHVRNTLKTPREASALTRKGIFLDISIDILWHFVTTEIVLTSLSTSKY